jgi:hypothetical protein
LGEPSQKNDICHQDILSKHQGGCSKLFAIRAESALKEQVKFISSQR